MLTEQIIEYAKARRACDMDEMKRIARNLRNVGMDLITLNALADDVDNGLIKEAEEKS